MNRKNDGDSGPVVCPPCEILLGEQNQGLCTGFKDYLTPEEEEVLARLRGLKEQARELRGKIRGIDQTIERELFEKPDHALTGSEKERKNTQVELYEEWESCSQRLEELRTVWKEWQTRKEEAYRRKMIMLGHLPPDDDQK